jgi:hypothetical protein
LSAEADKLPAIHIVGSDGVTFYKTCTAEVFRSASKPENRSFPISRLARTPPSTFLFLHLHLSNSPGSEDPTLPSLEGSGRTYSTANNNRLLSAADSLIIMRSFTGTSTCLGRGPMQRRAQWPVYKPAQSMLSTPIVNKSSHDPGVFSEADNSRLSQRFTKVTPYLSHNPATF